MLLARLYALGYVTSCDTRPVSANKHDVAVAVTAGPGGMLPRQASSEALFASPIAISPKTMVALASAGSDTQLIPVPPRPGRPSVSE